MNNRYKISLLSIALLLGVSLTILLVKQSEPPLLEFDAKQGIPVFSPPVPVPALTLVDQDNKPFPTAKLQDSWSLMFFGFTNCPDICPTTLTTMNQAAKRLSDKQIRYLFVSLDPQRDTPEKLKEYVTYFNSDFIGLSGNKADIDQLSEKLGVIYDYEGDVDSGKYTVNHYAAILVIDPQGRVRAHILPPHPVDKIVDGVNKIINYYQR